MSRLLIMLTGFHDAGARLIGLMTRSRYTHASIGLEEDPGTFYSFCTKGFREEHPKGLLKKEHAPFPCMVYALDVHDGAYRMAKRMIEGFRADRGLYRYSFIGVVLALLHIPFRIGRRFFCSQFVADILERSGAMPLRKLSCLCMPGDFQRMTGLSLFFSGTIQGYAASLA